MVAFLLKLLANPLLMNNHIAQKYGFSAVELWMNNENTEGSPLPLIASVVEDAQVILITMSENYKNSNLCRTGSQI